AFARFTFPSWCEMSMTTLSGLDMFASVRQSLAGVRMAVHQLIGRRSVLLAAHGAWVRCTSSDTDIHSTGGPILSRRAERNVADHVLKRRIWMRAGGNTCAPLSAH